MSAKTDSHELDEATYRSGVTESCQMHLQFSWTATTPEMAASSWNQGLQNRNVEQLGIRDWLWNCLLQHASLFLPQPYRRWTPSTVGREMAGRENTGAKLGQPSITFMRHLILFVYPGGPFIIPPLA